MVTIERARARGLAGETERILIVWRIRVDGQIRFANAACGRIFF